MKKISLTKRKFAIVDEKDFDFLNKWKWYCNPFGYAVREQSVGKNKSINIFMHRLINRTPMGLDTDHIDGNRLNNCKSNLRTLPHNKNMFNLRTAKNNNSGHRGVSWVKSLKKWRSYINLNRRQFHLGLFSSLGEAILSRRVAEQKYHVI